MLNTKQNEYVSKFFGTTASHFDQLQCEDITNQYQNQYKLIK